MPYVMIQLENKLIEAVEKQAQTLHLSKSAYIRKAIEQMCTQRDAQELRASLMRASRTCRAESMRINKEFSPIERDVEND